MCRLLAAGGLLLAVALVSLAQAPPDTAPRWEYKVLSKDEVIEMGKKDLAAGLNQLGGEGWELAAVDGAYIFKRPQARGKAADAGQIALLEADVEYLKDHLAWAERMVKRGFMAANSLKAERESLRRAELLLDAARRQVEGVPAPKASAPAK
jgi:hypothetical protein